MRIETLEIFLSVADTGYISRAAQMHHLTQPAISAQVLTLENELEKKLFERSLKQRKPLKLTKDGEIFYSYAYKMLELHDAMLREMNKANGEKFSLTVATSPTNGTHVFPYIIETFKKIHPNVDVRVIMEQGSNIHRKLLDGGCHIAITTNSDVCRDEILYEKFMNDPLVLIARSDYPAKNTIAIGQLVTLPIVLRVSGATSLKILNDELIKFGYSIKDLNIVLEVLDNESVKQSVLAGFSAGFVTASSIKAHRGEFRVINIKNLKFDRNLYLMRLKNGIFTRAMHYFWNFTISKKWNKKQ